MLCDQFRENLGGVFLRRLILYPQYKMRRNDRYSTVSDASHRVLYRSFRRISYWGYSMRRLRNTPPNPFSHSLSILSKGNERKSQKIMLFLRKKTQIFRKCRVNERKIQRTNKSSNKSSKNAVEQNSPSAARSFSRLRNLFFDLGANARMTISNTRER